MLYSAVIETAAYQTGGGSALSTLAGLALCALGLGVFFWFRRKGWL